MFLFLRAVANNYYFCQYLRILTHYNLLKSFFIVRSRNFHCFVTDIRNYTTASGEETFNVKLPSMSVITPLVVPFSSTLAPITDSPVASNHQSFHRTGLHDGLYSPQFRQKRASEEPANNAAASITEKKSFLDENFKKSFFIRL